MQWKKNYFPFDVFRYRNIGSIEKEENGEQFILHFFFWLVKEGEKKNMCFTFVLVKLNLFNYMLVLFLIKFSGNSAFRNLIFRWE